MEYFATKSKCIEMEDRLFALGVMDEAPCFCCGYSGPGYYQPEQHACASRHHKFKNRSSVCNAAAHPP